MLGCCVEMVELFVVWWGRRWKDDEEGLKLKDEKKTEKN